MEISRWETIESLFNETLRLPNADREGFLETACQGDATLRQEIVSLLREVDRPDEFLSQSTFTLGAKLLGATSPEAVQGQKLGNYTILKTLGRGGMGDVFLAEDNTLKRLVALKLLPGSPLGNTDSALRFRQEARAASAISHPNIGHIYEFGHVDDREYLVMEYVEGKTLRELLKKGPLEVERAIDITMQIAQALQAAHQANIIHRDVKPENVMIRRDGYVKVLDFGLAKVTPENPGEFDDRRPLTSPLETSPGVIMGTTAYMSPEQMRGRPVDTRTDVWSLGVTLYEMLAGKQPFPGETPSDTSAAVLLKEPARLEIAQLSNRESELTNQIVAKALEKQAEKRYASITEFLDALRELQSEVSRTYRSSLPLWDATTGKQSLGPTPAFQRTSPNLGLITNVHNYWVQRTAATKALIVAAVVAITVLPALGVASLLRNRQSPAIVNALPVPTNKIESLVILPFDNEPGEARTDFLSAGLVDDLIRNIGRSRAFPVISLTTAQRAKERKLNYDQMRDQLKATNVLEGKVKQSGDEIVIETKLVDLRTLQVVWQDKLGAPKADLIKVRNALALLLANKLQEHSEGEKHLVFAEYPTGNNEAYKLYLKAKFDRRRSSVAEFKDLIALLEEAVALDNRYTLAYVALAENYNLLGTFLGQSPSLYQPRAKQALEKALALDDSLAEAHAMLAKIKMDYEHDWPGAEREFRRAIELNPNDEQAHHWYGEVYLSAMKRLDESISELEIAHRLNPLSSGILTGLAWSYIGKGQYQKALEECDRAFAANPDDVGIYEYRAKAFFKLGRFDEAIADARKCFELDKTARYAATLAVFYALSGRQSEARDLLRRLRTDKSIGEVSDYDLAIVHGALGERDDAFRLLNAEVNSNSVDLLSIQIDPLLDELRDDPRFAELERRFRFS